MCFTVFQTINLYSETRVTTLKIQPTHTLVDRLFIEHRNNTKNILHSKGNTMGGLFAYYYVYFDSAIQLTAIE